MLRQLVLSRVPVDLSIVEFDLDDAEDIFLTYTTARRHGPGIKRTGKGPPFMNRIGGQAGQTTSHPFGLRLGTWLIQERLRADELRGAKQALECAQQSGAPAEDLAVLEDTVRELPSIPAHDQVFHERCPGYEIIGQQGCGDLTMNLWNVAYLNNALGQKPPELVYLREEPLEYRTYACLIKWKATNARERRLTIEEVRFNAEPGDDPNKMVWVRHGNQWLPRAMAIDFAVSNQQVIRDGQIVPIHTINHQFSDFRHLIQMPSLNRDKPMYFGEPAQSGGGYRPREFFNEPQYADIWLGEVDFLADENLQRAALSGPVFLGFPPGANELLRRGALQHDYYREVASALQPLAPGEWRFVRRNPVTILLEIYFKRNSYAWTMIGLNADNRRILCLACTADRQRGTGYTLEEAAELLLRAGAHNALLIDEGEDVFQQVRLDDGLLEDKVPRIRRRLRATFLFARRRA